MKKPDAVPKSFQDQTQIVEDKVWGEAAKEAEKSGFLGPEETMALLLQGPARKVRPLKPHQIDI